jgi:phage terminase small subunit
MGMRGPKSSAELAAIEQQRQRTAIDQVFTEDDLPAPPAHLSDEAKAWWGEIVGDIQVHQLRTLQAGCEAWDQYQEAMMVVRELGMSYADDRGRRFARPEVSIARDSRTAFVRCMKELRLDKPPPKEAVDRNAHLGLSWRQLQQNRNPPWENDDEG